MDALTLTLAGCAGFLAGMLDSIVGGGGLIMTPAMVNLFPELSILQVTIDRRLMLFTCLSAAAASAPAP